MRFSGQRTGGLQDYARAGGASLNFPGRLPITGLNDQKSPTLADSSSHSNMCVYSRNLKSCASCAFWGGPRRTLRAPAREIDTDRYTTGPCAHIRRRGVLCCENAVCQDYLRWSAIDEQSIAIITG